MSIKSDRWIRRMAESQGMIEPFEAGQVKQVDGQRITDEWQPRVGMTYDLSGDGRTVFAGGADTIMITSEDIFLYEQGPRFETNVSALKKLFESVAAVPGVGTSPTGLVAAPHRRRARGRADPREIAAGAVAG